MVQQMLRLSSSFTSIGPRDLNVFSAIATDIIDKENNKYKKQLHS